MSGTSIIAQIFIPLRPQSLRLLFVLKRWFWLLIVAPIVCGGSVYGPCSLMQCISRYAFSLISREIGCFTFIVFLMPCDC